MSDAIVTIEYERKVITDEDADLSHLEDTAGNYEGCTPEEIAIYVAQDQARLEAYDRCEWHMVAVKAVAKITVTRGLCSTHYKLESAGIWGIESDSGESYFEEVYQDELSSLRADIDAIAQRKVTP